MEETLTEILRHPLFRLSEKSGNTGRSWFLDAHDMKLLLEYAKIQVEDHTSFLRSPEAQERLFTGSLNGLIGEWIVKQALRDYTRFLYYYSERELMHKKRSGETDYDFAIPTANGRVIKLEIKTAGPRATEFSFNKDRFEKAAFDYLLCVKVLAFSFRVNGAVICDYESREEARRSWKPKYGSTGRLLYYFKKIDPESMFKRPLKDLWNKLEVQKAIHRPK